MQPLPKPKMQPFNRTITALSTPPGKGGVALIRLSGEDAIEIAERVFRAKNGKAVSALPSRYATYGDVYFEGEPIDDVLLTVFRAPSSYTGEDTVEIASHGGMLITEAILTALYAEGAVPASPGEFTRRAYTAGKLSLSEAEAIGELLDAKSMAQVKLFGRDSRMKLSGALSDLYENVRELLSSLCARLDYPDEDLGEISTDEILARVTEAKQKSLSLLATYKTGKAVTEGIPTVLLGKPNTGKSSLYNLLVGKDAAIVTSLAGTTRDILETTVPLGRVLLRLYDTAGLRNATDEIEQIGVDRARRAMQEADLILAVFDTSAPLTEEDHALLRELATLGATKIAILNKSDLTAVSAVPAEGFAASVTLSAKHGTTEVLSAEIDRLFTDGDIVIGEAAIVSSARQYAALTRAHECLMQAKNALTMGHPADMYLFDLCEGLSALGEVDGRTVGEEIVSEIFSHFCVGK